MQAAKNMADFNGLNVLLMCLRLMKYLRINAHMRLLLNTLSRSVKEIMLFMLLVIVLLAGYVICGQVVIGLYDERFNQIGEATQALVRTVLRDVNYNAYIADGAELYFVVIFYISFTILFTWVILNVLLSIIVDSWAIEKTIVEATAVRHDHEDLYVRRERAVG